MGSWQKQHEKKRKFIGYTQRKDQPMCVVYICAKSHIFSVIYIFYKVLSFFYEVNKTHKSKVSSS